MIIIDDDDNEGNNAERETGHVSATTITSGHVSAAKTTADKAESIDTENVIANVDKETEESNATR